MAYNLRPRPISKQLRENDCTSNTDDNTSSDNIENGIEEHSVASSEYSKCEGTSEIDVDLRNFTLEKRVLGL